MKLGDILFEKHAHHRGRCECCEREDVPVNAKNVCFPCYVKTPGLSAAIDKSAERITDSIIAKARGEEPSKREDN